MQNFSALTPSYWKQCTKNLKNVRMLALAGLVVALVLTLKSLTVVLMGNTLKIQFSFLAVALGCYVYGPCMGILVGVAGDVLGFMITNYGDPFFPGYTLSAMLTGLMGGLLFYRRKITILRLAVFKLLVNYVNNVLIGSLWKHMLYGNPYLVYASTGLIKNSVMLLVEIPLLVVVFTIMIPVLQSSGFVEKTYNKKGRLSLY